MTPEEVAELIANAGPLTRDDFKALCDSFAGRVAELEAENTALRAENERLRQKLWDEDGALEAENTTLRERYAQAQDAIDGAVAMSAAYEREVAAVLAQARTALARHALPAHEHFYEPSREPNCAMCAAVAAIDALTGEP